jgi:GMP synthase-like glutamine amidotransferase
MPHFVEIKVAVLLNAYRKDQSGPSSRSCFSEIFRRVNPSIHLDFFDTVKAQQYPNLGDKYDAIVLSGSAADINVPAPWIDKLMAFLRRVSQDYPKTKIVGICWGHQACVKAFGGQIHEIPDGPEVSTHCNIRTAH